MLKHIVTLSLLLLAGGTLFAGDTRFHRGGVTFPMEKISAERFAVKSVPAGKNLIKNSDFTRDFVPSKNKLNGWCKGRWMFGEENRKKFFAKAVKLTETKISTVDGKKVLDLNRPAELEKLMGAQTPNIYISAEQRIPLPDAQGGIYKFTFQYKTQKIGSTNSNRCVLIYYYSEIEKGKNTRSYQAVYFPVSPVWTNHSVELTVPAGTKALNIGFRGTGCGRALITNAALVKADKGKFPVEIEVTPMKMLDNVYVLASGDPGILAMRLRTALPKGAFKERSVSLEMTLPAEVELLGANGSFASAYTSKDMIIKGKKYKKWLLDFTAAMPAHFRSSNSFTGWNIQAGTMKLHLRLRSGRAMAVVSSLLWLAAGFFTEMLLEAGVCVVFQLLAGIFTAWGGRRTPQGRQMACKVLGLRHYLKGIKREEVKTELDRNPDYFFEMAPYAMAMGVDNAFASRFGGRIMPPCSYLDADRSLRRNARGWIYLMQVTARKMDDAGKRAKKYRKR